MDNFFQKHKIVIFISLGIWDDKIDHFSKLCAVSIANVWSNARAGTIKYENTELNSEVLKSKLRF